MSRVAELQARRQSLFNETARVSDGDGNSLVRQLLDPDSYLNVNLTSAQEIVPAYKDQTGDFASNHQLGRLTAVRDLLKDTIKESFGSLLQARDAMRLAGETGLPIAHVFEDQSPGYYVPGLTPAAYADFLDEIVRGRGNEAILKLVRGEPIPSHGPSRANQLARMSPQSGVGVGGEQNLAAIGTPPDLKSLFPKGQPGRRQAMELARNQQVIEAGIYSVAEIEAMVWTVDVSQRQKLGEAFERVAQEAESQIAAALNFIASGGLGQETMHHSIVDTQVHGTFAANEVVKGTRLGNRSLESARRAAARQASETSVISSGQATVLNVDSGELTRESVLGHRAGQRQQAGVFSSHTRAENFQDHAVWNVPPGTDVRIEANPTVTVGPQQVESFRAAAGKGGQAEVGNNYARASGGDGPVAASHVTVQSGEVHASAHFSMTISRR